MHNRTYAHLDPSQVSNLTFDPDLEATRVILVGGDTIKVEAKTSEPIIVEKIEYKEIEKPIIVKETEIKYVDKPFIVKETEYKEIETPVVVKETEIKYIDKPFCVKEIEYREIEKPIIIKEVEYREIVKIPYWLTIVITCETLLLLGLIVKLL